MENRKLVVTEKMVFRALSQSKKVNSKICWGVIYCRDFADMKAALEAVFDMVNKEENHIVDADKMVDFSDVRKKICNCKALGATACCYICAKPKKQTLLEYAEDKDMNYRKRNDGVHDYRKLLSVISEYLEKH